MKDFLKADRVSRRKNIRSLNAENVLKRINEDNANITDVDNTTVINESYTDRADTLKRKGERKRQLTSDRLLAEEHLDSLFISALTGIVLESLPIDDEIVDSEDNYIYQNIKGFISEMFDDRIISVKDFVKSESAVVRSFANSVISEESDCDDDNSKEKITDIIKAKAKKVIEDEIESEEEVNATVASLKESTGTGTGLSGFRRRRGNPRVSFFRSLINESLKDVIESKEDIDMEAAMAEASIKYTLLETFNTMNIITDRDILLKRLR